MKRIILIVMMVSLVATPCVALQEDVLQSIEGTAWYYTRGMSSYGERSCYIGFYDDDFYLGPAHTGSGECLYRSSRPGAYIDLPGVGMFWLYKDPSIPRYSCWGRFSVGLLFPMFGYGVKCCGMEAISLTNNMSLPEDICPLGIRNHMMTMNPMVDWGCMPPTSRNTFSRNSEAAYCWMSYFASLEDEIRCEWHKPNGELYQEDLILAPYNAGCWYPSILISGHTPANTPGEWSVDVYFKGIKAFTEYFTIYKIPHILWSHLDRQKLDIQFCKQCV